MYTCRLQPHLAGVCVPGSASTFHINQCSVLKSFEKQARYICRKRERDDCQRKRRKTSCQPSLTERFISFFLPLGGLLCVLLYACGWMHRTCALVIFLVCMSGCNVHILYTKIYGTGMSQRRLQQCGARGASSGKLAKDKILSHIHTLYLWKPGSW